MNRDNILQIDSTRVVNRNQLYSEPALRGLGTAPLACVAVRVASLRARLALGALPAPRTGCTREIDRGLTRFGIDDLFLRTSSKDSWHWVHTSMGGDGLKPELTYIFGRTSTSAAVQW